MAARRPHLLSVQDRRTLGIDQQVGQFFDVAGIAERAGRGAVVAGPRDDGLGYLDLAIEDIARKFPGTTGPGAPLNASRAAIEINVRDALGARYRGANLVIGDMRSTCGRSWRDPILC